MLSAARSTQARISEKLNNSLRRLAAGRGHLAEVGDGAAQAVADPLLRNRRRLGLRFRLRLRHCRRTRRRGLEGLLLAAEAALEALHQAGERLFVGIALGG